MKTNIQNSSSFLSEITLRDFFASQALQAIISKVPVDISTDGIRQESIALGAYTYADAMMEARK